MSQLIWPARLGIYDGGHALVAAGAINGEIGRMGRKGLREDGPAGNWLNWHKINDQPLCGQATDHKCEEMLSWPMLWPLSLILDDRKA